MHCHSGAGRFGGWRPGLYMLRACCGYIRSKFVTSSAARFRNSLRAMRHGESAAGVTMGAVLFCLVLASLFLAGEVQQVHFNGFMGLSTQASASLAAAVGEELLFRGAIFRIAEEWLGTTAALIISAVLFGAAHGLNSGATPISVAAIALEAGVLLGVAYSASRSLWLPIGMHFGWNFTEGGLFGASVSGGQSMA